MADIEEIKRRVDLATFCEKRWGLRFEHAGRQQQRALCPLHQEKTPSFVVFPDGGWYCYGGCNRGGDILDLVMAKDGMDFREALELVAREAGIELQSFTPQQRASYQARRNNEGILATAVEYWERCLWENEGALAYCRGRGWMDETLKAHHLGYAPGRETLAGAFATAGIDAKAPWAQAALYMPEGMLVYPHCEGGRVTYVSGRVANETEKGHYNPPNDLIGARRVYWNQRVPRTPILPPSPQGREDECVIVEGQADAVTLGQWGIPAVALAGCGLTAAATQGLIQRLKRFQTLYVWPDADGRTDVTGIGTALGPMTRIIVPPEGVKDANEWLQGGATEKDANLLLATADPWVVMLARGVGTTTGAAREAGMRHVFTLMAGLDDFSAAMYREKVAQYLGVGLREFNKMLSTLRPEEKEEGEATINLPLVGGWIHEHLVEMLYQPPTSGKDGDGDGKTDFAVRTPDGQIKRIPWVEFGGVRYVPINPMSRVLSEKVVHFPTEIGEVKNTRELVDLIQKTIHYYLDVDVFYETLASYYVLFTWVYDSFNTLPYLRALGDTGTGKSRLIQVIGGLCYRPTFVSGAATVSPVFRILDQYRGTLIMDEADFRYSDESADYIKILNTGYQRIQGTVLRSGDRQVGFEPEVFVVYGPKVIATRNRFKDPALESRCLTKEMGGPTTRADIPIDLPMKFWTEEAVKIRNLLLRYRLDHWIPQMELDYTDLDTAIEPRLNQVTVALKTMVADPDLRAELNMFIKEYNRQLIMERGMTLASKVLEVLLVQVLMADGKPENADLSMAAIAHRVNLLIDQENYGDIGEERDEEDKRSPARQAGGRIITPRRVGQEVRNTLHLGVDRDSVSRRYKVIWDAVRIEGLRRRFGVDEDLVTHSQGVLVELEKQEKAKGGHEEPPTQGTIEELNF